MGRHLNSSSLASHILAQYVVFKGKKSSTFYSILSTKSGQLFYCDLKHPCRGNLIVGSLPRDTNDAVCRDPCQLGVSLDLSLPERFHLRLQVNTTTNTLIIHILSSTTFNTFLLYHNPQLSSWTSSPPSERASGESFIASRRSRSSNTLRYPADHNSNSSSFTPFAARTTQYVKEQLGQTEDKVRYSAQWQWLALYSLAHS